MPRVLCGYASVKRMEIISRYFPGYPAEIKARLGGGDPRTVGMRSTRSGHPGAVGQGGLTD